MRYCGGACTNQWTWARINTWASIDAINAFLWRDTVGTSPHVALLRFKYSYPKSSCPAWSAGGSTHCKFLIQVMHIWCKLLEQRTCVIRLLILTRSFVFKTTRVWTFNNKSLDNFASLRSTRSSAVVRIIHCMSPFAAHQLAIPDCLDLICHI